MITRVAIKKGNYIYIGEEGKRHDSVILSMIERGIDLNGIIQGFVDDGDNFLNRHDAAKHAFECGQIKDETCPDIIVSEDLW